MVWTYRITAVARPRLIMRLAQIYDQQMLVIDRMNVVREHDAAAIRIESNAMSTSPIASTPSYIGSPTLPMSSFPTPGREP